MTGRRFARLEERILTLEERLQTLESVKTQKQAAESQEHSAEYLKIAEYFALLVLFPYYFPGYFSKMLSLAWEKEFKPDSSGYKWLTVASFVLGGAFSERKRLHRYTINAVKYLKHKNESIKKNVKNKRKNIVIRWNKVKSLTRKWKEAAKSFFQLRYDSLTIFPKKTIDGFKRLIKRRPPTIDQ